MNRFFTFTALVSLLAGCALPGAPDAPDAPDASSAGAGGEAGASEQPSLAGRPAHHPKPHVPNPLPVKFDHGASGEGGA